MVVTRARVERLAPARCQQCQIKGERIGITATNVADAVLFAGFDPPWRSKTVAVVRRGPAALSPVRATTVTTALLPKFRLPRLQVTARYPNRFPDSESRKQKSCSRNRIDQCYSGCG